MLTNLFLKHHKFVGRYISSCLFLHRPSSSDKTVSYKTAKNEIDLCFVNMILLLIFQNLTNDGIINCQTGAGGKRPSKIDIPCVVSIGKTFIKYHIPYYLG